MAVYRRSGFSRLFGTPTQSSSADALRLARMRENLVKAKLASAPLSEDLLKDEAAYATQARGGQLAQAAQQKAGAQARALEELIHIEEQEQQYPGRRLGGTGMTGLLLSTDARGYRDMLAQQQARMDIEQALGGKPKPTVSPYYTEESFPAPYEPLPHPSLGREMGAGAIGVQYRQRLEEQMRESTGSEKERLRKILEGLREAGGYGIPSWVPQRR